MLTNGGCGAYNHVGRAVSLAGLTAPPSWLQSRKALAVKQRSSYSWRSQGDSDLIENEKKSTYTTSSLLQVKEEKGMSLRVIRPILHRRTILSILLL